MVASHLLVVWSDPSKTSQQEMAFAGHFAARTPEVGPASEPLSTVNNRFRGGFDATPYGASTYRNPTCLPFLSFIYLFFPFPF
jgi:hypothetical protein